MKNAINLDPICSKVYLENEIREYEDTLFTHTEILSLKELQFSKIKLGIERALIHVWKKDGMLPHETKKKFTWTRFSFTEICGLSMLRHFRKQGVSKTTIKKVKEQLFENIDLQINAKDVTNISPDSYGIEARKFTLPKLTFILYLTINNKACPIIYMTEDSKPTIFNINNSIDKQSINIEDILQLMQRANISALNLACIIHDLCKLHDNFKDSPRLKSLLISTFLSNNKSSKK